MKILRIKALSMPLSLVAVLLVLSISVLAATQSFAVPLALSVSIPCANQGNGEVVDFSGTLHELFSLTVNGNNFHLNELANPQGVKGVGETTGEVWEGTGETRLDLTGSVIAFPSTSTFVNNFKLINARDGSSFLVHENAHVTINANGTLTVLQDNPTFSCK